MNVRRVTVLTVLALCALTPAGAGAGASIVVGDVWSRPATANAVVYCTIRNGGSSGDALIGAAAPGAQHAEIHETTTAHAPSSPMPGMPMAATVSMRYVASVPVPAGGQATLKPGGYHIMLIGLKRRWNLGDSFQIRLHFKQSGWISTTGFVMER